MKGVFQQGDFEQHGGDCSEGLCDGAEALLTGAAEFSSPGSPDGALKLLLSC